jgi:radical SAM protein with 4Fe4S-binding SPASM domain
MLIIQWISANFRHNTHGDSRMFDRIYSLPMSLFLNCSARLRNYSVANRYFGLPRFVQIEVTTKCNLHCNQCQRNKDSPALLGSNMSLHFFRSIIDQLRYPTTSVHLVGLGEPLLNPEIFSMIQTAKDKGLEVSLISNFTLVDRKTSLALIKSGLDYLYVSFDSVSKKTFEQIRTGACFEEVVANIELFVKIKKEVKAKKPFFLFKSTISKSNFAEIPQLIKLADKLGADGINFGKLMSEDDSCTDLFPNFLNEANLPKSRILVDPCELSESYQCDAISGCCVTYDGKILPCGLMLESLPRALFEEHQLGDLKIDKIADIWRANNYVNFRRKIALNKFLLPCKTCPANRHPPPNTQNRKQQSPLAI